MFTFPSFPCVLGDSWLEPGEQYLGWVSSSNLHKGFGMGYGVYVTDRRVVGVRLSRSYLFMVVVGFLVAVFGGVGLAILASVIFTGSIAASQSYSTSGLVIAIIGFFLFWGLLQTRMKKSAPQSFQELPSKTDFSLRREEIAQIQLKEPTLWHGGHLAIDVNQGKMLKVKLGLGQGQRVSKEFTELRSLMQTFCNGPPPIKFEIQVK